MEMGIGVSPNPRAAKMAAAVQRVLDLGKIAAGSLALETTLCNYQ